MRTKEEFKDFYNRYRFDTCGYQYSDDDWEYFIPKLKMFEISRRLKDPIHYNIDYDVYRRKRFIGSSTEDTVIIEDFYQFCRDMELRNKIKKIKNKLNE
jgi:hypothetical protein